VISGGGRYISPTFARQDVTVRAEKDSTITGVTITNANTRGTALWIESTNQRSEQYICSNRDGILSPVQLPQIEDNVFTRNGGNGISVARSAQERCNNVFQDTGFGLAIGGTSDLVAENQIIENADGLLVSDSARPVLRNNVIEKTSGMASGSVNAQPDLGSESEGKISFAVTVATGLQRNVPYVAVGDIDTKRISGKVDVVAGQIAFQDVQGYWAQRISKL